MYKKQEVNLQHKYIVLGRHTENKVSLESLDFITRSDCTVGKKKRDREEGFHGFIYVLEYVNKSILENSLDLSFPRRLVCGTDPFRGPCARGGGGLQGEQLTIFREELQGPRHLSV